MAKVFDTVWHDGLVHNIKQIGYSENITQNTTSNLEGRKFNIKVEKNFSDYRKSITELQQERVLSPLYSVYSEVI